MPGKITFGLLIGLACGGQGVAGQTPVYELLYSPPPGLNYPTSIFEAGEPGLFYTESAGIGGYGASILAVSSGGGGKAIYSFGQEGAQASLIAEATNGKVYGAITAGTKPYQNSYYSIDLSGKNLQLTPFPPPWGSAFGPTVAPPNQIYDLVGRLVSNYEQYAFASVSESGQITILHPFSAADGVPEYIRMILGPDGNLYGIGNQKPSGVSQIFIYRFTPSGTYSRLLNFPSVPGYDAFPLVVGSDGNLYGSFSGGGVNNTGEIYQVTLSGGYQVVASLPASIRSPRTLAQAADGNLYGTTVYNQIFSYNLATHAVALVYQMNSVGGQGQCGCYLVEGMDGKLYGTAGNGGPTGYGTVFSLDLGLPKPLPAVTGLYPSSGKVGQPVLLWGNYLLGATSVTFNGVSAAHPVSTSVQSVAVTVPAGATTGPVTITTANGSFTTTQNFIVQ